MKKIENRICSRACLSFIVVVCLSVNTLSQTFVDVSSEIGLPALNTAAHAGWGDYNNDGWVDLALGGYLYRNDQGTGIRARYWVFDQYTVAPHSMIPPTASLNVRSVDLELTKVAHIGSIAAEFLGGLRYGKVEHLWNSEGLDFEGVGPQLGVDLSIPTQTNISLYGGTRAAVLFGSTKNDERGMGSPGEDDLVPVFELRLGTEYTRCLGSGWFTLRSGVEAQFWAAGSADPNSDLSSETSSDENLGFLGYVIGAEFRR